MRTGSPAISRATRWERRRSAPRICSAIWGLHFSAGRIWIADDRSFARERRVDPRAPPRPGAALVAAARAPAPVAPVPLIGIGAHCFLDGEVDGGRDAQHLRPERTRAIGDDGRASERAVAR